MSKCGDTKQEREENAGNKCASGAWLGVNSYCVVEDSWQPGQEYNPESSCLPADQIPACGQHPYKICTTCDNNRHGKQTRMWFQGQCPDEHTLLTSSNWPGSSNCAYQINICKLNKDNSQQPW